VTENEVSNALLRRRIIPVVVLEELETARPLAEALEQGGLPVAEVTFRTEAAADAVRFLTHEKRLLVGAGTVVRPEQVDLAVEAGARFIVMPGVSPRVVERCRELDVLVIPGVATATEVIAALDHGLDLLKIFPAQVAGGRTPARATSAVSRRALDPHRRYKRGKRRLLSRTAVGGGRRGQLDGRVRADLRT
jgi:2-dehydro-3-deoxyphosphogluconate aldolase/(4S)-4-hydroxy-2-oxoglutarate aldolase